MTIAASHIGQFYYQKEATYDEAWQAAAQQIPSDSVTSVTATPAMNLKRLINIAGSTPVDTIAGAHDYTVNVEYALQDVTATHTLALSLESLALTRTAGDLSSIRGCLMMSPSAAYMIFGGGKINTISYTFAVGQSINVACEIWFNTMTSAAAAPTGTTPTTLATAFDIFNGATVTRASDWVAGIKGGVLTINNNLERIPKVKATTAQGGDYTIIMPGIQEVTFTGDIIADTGGKLDMDDLLIQSETDIVIASKVGDALGYKWTLTKPTLNNEPVTYTADMTTLILGANLGAESIALAAST